MNFLRILQVFPHVYTQATVGGGILEYVRNISERLGKKHDVTIFSTASGSFSRYEEINGVKIERFQRLAPGRAYFLSLDMALRLFKSDFDVVHAHCYQAFPAHFSILAKRKKLILSTHFHGVGHSNFRNSLLRIAKPFGERTLQVADKIIAVSKYEKNLLCNYFQIDSDKIEVIPCGVNFDEFNQLKKQKRPFNSILYVGRLRDYKGPQFLVEVLPKLDKDVLLEIVGTGPMQILLKARAKELNVLDRITFYQDLPRSALLQKFVNADIFVLLSKFEAYSMAVAEALVAGTPCIVADTTALSEWIDNKNCFGIDYPINLNSLANLIKEVIKNKEANKTISKSEKIQDWNKVVEQLECVYEN